jgi:hypothetical protein
LDKTQEKKITEAMEKEIDFPSGRDPRKQAAQCARGKNPLAMCAYGGAGDEYL